MPDLTWHDRAELHLGSGRLLVADSDMGERLVCQLPKGDYTVRIVHPDYDEHLANLAEVTLKGAAVAAVGAQIGTLDVEMGSILLANAAAEPEYEVWYYLKPAPTAAQAYYNFSTGGDGQVPVFGLLDASGQVVGVRLVVNPNALDEDE